MNAKTVGKPLAPHHLILLFFVLLLATFGLLQPLWAAIPFAVEDQPVPTLAPMLSKATPAVVNIATLSHDSHSSPLMEDPFFRHFFSKRRRTAPSLGSGVIIDARKGHILTNHHVIEHAHEIKVTLQDGRTFNAQVIGADSESDIAVIGIKAKNLVALPLGNSDQLRVGDFVVAIGSPFGLSQSVTSGIVSGLGRSGLGIEGYEDFIQTDASINLGNSGGALIDLRGHLIGINTAIVAPSGGNIGIGFAIPINMAREITKQLLKNGSVKRGQLGVHIQDLSPNLAKALGVSGSINGAVVAKVVRGSAADKAGLQAEDIIIAVDDHAIRSASALRNTIGMIPIDTRIRITILRSNREIKVYATIGSPMHSKLNGVDLHPRLAGATFGELRRKSSSGRHRKEGVEVLEVKRNSAAWNLDLRPGDIIRSVNRSQVKNIKQFRYVINSNAAGILLNILRGDNALFLAIH